MDIASIIFFFISSSAGPDQTAKLVFFGLSRLIGVTEQPCLIFLRSSLEYKSSHRRRSVSAAEKIASDIIPVATESCAQAQDKTFSHQKT